MMIQSSALGTSLAPNVYGMVRAYVLRKTQSRTNTEWEEFKQTRDEERKKAYQRAREKVCTDAFLAMRSRRSREEFRDYFVGTICAVPQFLPDERYQELASALATDQWEEVRSLAMLALSAHSRV